MAALKKSKEQKPAKVYKVTKSNNLIRDSRSRMTAIEMKILCFVISEIEMGDKEFKPCEISIKDFCELCGVSPDSQYENLREITSKLRGRTIEFLDGRDIVQLGWLRECRYQKDYGKILIQMEDKLAPQLLELKKNFTSYGVSNILLLKSKYSMQIYEILKSYENLGFWNISVEELKHILYAEKYEFSDLRKRVIQPALLEINEKTDLSVSCEFTKDGKKISGIKFYIKRSIKESTGADAADEDMNYIINDVIGIKRKPTAKEYKYIKKWFLDYHFSFPMIEEAYSRTVEHTGEMSFAYMDKIIEAWHSRDIRTPEQAAEEQTERKQDKNWRNDIVQQMLDNVDYYK